MFRTTERREAVSERFQLLQGDCLDLMKQIPDGSVNLVVTSPPYNVGLEYASYKDDKPFEEYIGFLKEVFLLAYGVLAEDGRVVINIGDGKSGKMPTHSVVQMMMCDIGYVPMATIIWNKRTTSNRAAWGSFMSPSCPSFPSCMEYVMLFSKTPKLLHKGTPTIQKEDFIKWTSPLWEFMPETRIRDIGHPAAFPIELPRRCIELLTYREDTVLDMFMGSGTTGVACVNTNRRFIGIEKDEKYFAIAKDRIEKAISTPKQGELL